MAESDALRARFADLRGGERRLRNPPPNGQGGAMLAEGFRLVRQAQDLGHHLEALLVRSDYRGPLPPGDYGVLVLDPPEVNRLTGFGDMREMAGLFPRPPDRAPADVARTARRLLVLEGVANPGNVGTIIRSAAALGVDATLVGPASGDPLGRRALRTSMGAGLTHPWAPDPHPLATCRGEGIATLALTPDPDARPIDDVLAERGGERLALVLGAEGPGLGDTTLQAADERVTIPIVPGVDSLNVAAAAAIAIYAVTTR